MIEMVFEKIQAGGILMIPILLVSFLAWFLILERYVILRGVIRANRRALARLGPKGEAGSQTPLIAELPARSAAGQIAEHARSGPEVFDGAASEVRLRERARLNRSLDTIGRLAGVAPLLGLLGTVSGMIVTFDAITIHGIGNPGAMAEGISQALLTTQAGLLTAIPVLIAQRYLARMAEQAETWIGVCLDRSREILFLSEGP